jgi:hypothetical protein
MNGIICSKFLTAVQVEPMGSQVRKEMGRSTQATTTRQATITVLLGQAGLLQRMSLIDDHGMKRSCHTDYLPRLQV